MGVTKETPMDDESKKGKSTTTALRKGWKCEGRWWAMKQIEVTGGGRNAVMEILRSIAVRSIEFLLFSFFFGPLLAATSKLLDSCFDHSHFLSPSARGREVLSWVKTGGRIGGACERRARSKTVTLKIPARQVSRSRCSPRGSDCIVRQI